MRRAHAAAIAVSCTLFAGVERASAQSAAFFRMDGPPHPETFVVKVKNPDKIAHIRRILSGEETEAVHVMGRVRASAKRWNRPWNYILAPRSVQFFELAIEVCDASIDYVEEHLDEVGTDFLPGRVWCPWGSRFLEEIEPR